VVWTSLVLSNKLELKGSSLFWWKAVHLSPLLCASPALPQLPIEVGVFPISMSLDIRLRHLGYREMQVAGTRAAENSLLRRCF
jgi:hypothetical protein